MKKGNKIDKALKFIEYISKNMEKEDLFLLYKINKITRERLEMYSDFVYSLNNLIITTYMGDDVTIGKERENHFKWCWKKTVSSFKNEGVYFVDAEELYQYFLSFYQESFYEEEKDDEKIELISNFWEELLAYDKTKTMSEYETLNELYKIFNKSFAVN